MSIKEKVQIISSLLADIETFCEYGSGIKLRSYQVEAARAIVDSVLNQKGLTFVVVFPRQSGKNELQAQIEAYLLATLALEDAEIVKISPTWKPQSQNAMRRLERVLSRNVITRKTWEKEQGYIYRIRRARVFFLSGAATANIIGATASTLLECDEAQDVSIAKWDKEVSPMAASTQATRVFWGTAWTSQTLLAREKQAALEAEKEDGTRRVFQTQAEEVAREAPAYGRYVREQVARLGRSHPFIRTQYFSEESEPMEGMFPAARRALMRGDHRALEGPREGRCYAFLIDVGGFAKNSETVSGFVKSNEPVGGFAKSSEPAVCEDDVMDIDRRDPSALTIVEVAAMSDPLTAGPRYRVVQRRLWKGASQPRLYGEITALAELWRPQRIVIDATGLGAGLAGFLEQRLGKSCVMPFVFSQKSKSDLGWAFLGVVDSGRFHDHAEEDRLQREFERQLAHCQMEMAAGPEKRLRWGVPDGTKDAATGEVVHDDLVISAALCATLDRVRWGGGDSVVVKAEDPFRGLREVY